MADDRRDVYDMVKHRLIRMNISDLLPGNLIRTAEGVNFVISIKHPNHNLQIAHSLYKLGLIRSDGTITQHHYDPDFRVEKLQ